MSYSKQHPTWVAALQGTGVDFSKLSVDIDGLYGTATSRTANLRPVYPDRDLVFRAFHEVMPDEVRAIVVGQDPYPQQDPRNRGAGIADGLSFSARGHEPPPSLRHILYNMWTSGVILTPPGSADLQGWANQGVLLLNTALSVEPSSNAAMRTRNRKRHQAVYRGLLSATLKYLSRPSGSEPAFLLLGEFARGFTPAIRNPKPGQVVALNHPSREPWPEPGGEPLPFVRLNTYLGKRAINWQL